MSSDELVIQLSKIKMVLLFLASICFVAIGVWLLTMDPEDIRDIRRNTSPQIVYGISMIGILFFGFCGLMILIKLLDTRPGLIINSEGITDNSGGLPAGFIPWSDISGIGEYHSQSQKFILLLVKNPEKYVNTGSALNKMAKQANFEFSGSAIQISAVNLKISYDELLNVIVDFHQKNSRNV